jgi:MoaA/NifB/PqqE/SkfB family radical SAM enzyme
MCYHPWVGLDISPQGAFRPCCKYQTAISNTLDGYLTSDELHKLRADFISGSRPAGCHRCWRDEDAGIESKRLLDFKYTFDNKIPATDHIQILSLPFGNTCNLACRICNSGSSSKWREEAIKLKTELPEIQVRDHVKFYDNNKFMDPILDLLPGITHIDIPGGEPL